MRAKIDINEVETRTKIRAKYLRAIENEEWSLLPGDVYVKSFLRTYADYLGLDSRQLIDDYKRRYERPTDHELRQIAPLGRERDRAIEELAHPAPARPPPRGPLIPPWAIIGVVLVGIVVALYFVGNHKGPTSTSSSTPTHAASPQPKAKHQRRAHRARTVRRARSSSSSFRPARSTSASSTGTASA